MQSLFLHLPSGFVLACYAPQPGGGVAVVTPSGQILAASFYDLKEKYTFGGVILGAGQWVILEPIAQPAQQPALF